MMYENIKIAPQVRLKCGLRFKKNLQVYNIILYIFLQGWYIVTYALGIYHLNLFIAFLTPKIDPAMDFDGKFFYIILCNLNPKNKMWSL